MDVEFISSHHMQSEGCLDENWLSFYFYLFPETLMAKLIISVNLMGFWDNTGALFTLNVFKTNPKATLIVSTSKERVGNATPGWTGLVSKSISPLKNVLVCLEARLILPFSYGRKRILDSRLKVDPLSARIKRSGAFTKQMLLPNSRQRPAGTAGFINNTLLFIGAAHPNPNLPLFNSGLFTAV